MTDPTNVYGAAIVNGEATGDERDGKSMKNVRWKDEGLDNVPRAL